MLLTITFFCLAFGAFPRLISKPIEAILAIWKKYFWFSFTLLLFQEHGLKFGSSKSPRNTLLSWITFQWDVENILFPHISRYVLSYFSRKDWIISGVELIRSSTVNIGYMYQNQEMMSFFVPAVKHVRFIFLFAFSKYKVEKRFPNVFCKTMLFFRLYLADKWDLIHNFSYVSNL